MSLKKEKKSRRFVHNNNQYIYKYKYVWNNSPCLKMESINGYKLIK